MFEFLHNEVRHRHSILTKPEGTLSSLHVHQAPHWTVLEFMLKERVRGGYSRLKVQPKQVVLGVEWGSINPAGTLMSLSVQIFCTQIEFESINHGDMGVGHL